MSTDSPVAITKQPRFWLLAVCGLLLFGLWLAQANPYLNVANDAGRYMTLGKSLAQSGELRLLNDPLRPLDTLYPPGFPALIAFWLRVTGRPPGGVVMLIKVTHLLLLLAGMPLLLTLLERARLPFRYCAAGLLIYAASPAVASYANEVMSEALFLVLCLASVVLVERDLKAPDLTAKTPRTPGEKEREREVSVEALSVPQEAEKGAGWRCALSLACAVGAFLTRSAGVSLLIAQAIWFWRRFGWKWGLVATLVGLLAVEGWQMRNRRIMAHAPPGVHYSTYMDQFSLRDPARPGAGRITVNARGLLSRAGEGFPIYIGMIPRVLLHAMSRQSPAWFVLFYFLAVPMALLILLGFVLAWRRGLHLSAGFAALFWLFAAMWPWRDPRFLAPILPLLVLFLMLGAAWCAERLAAWLGIRTVGNVEIALAALLLLYFGQVHGSIILREQQPLAPGYAFGRTPDEGGFYAACTWLHDHAPADSVLMGRPAYILALYADRVTVQIEPHPNPRVQEIAYMQKNHVRYLVEDAWKWSNTPLFLGPYLDEYSALWRLAWEDPNGSGVRIWERAIPYEDRPSDAKASPLEDTSTRP